MRVGTRELESEVKKREEDHPHACGDKKTTIGGCCVAEGSSPCVWGQATLKLLADDCARDHPHACGDKPVSDIAIKSSGGSSPCVWGQEL